MENKPAQMKFSVALTTDKYKQLINNTLGNKDQASKFIAAISSAVAVNKSLQECTPGSILSGALLGESLKLSPSPQLGHYYLVPYADNKRGVKLAQFQLGYKGYIQLAMRSGLYKDIDVIEIREGEYLGRDEETGKPKFKFIEDDDIRESTPIIGYRAYFEYLNGFVKVLYWSKTKMLNHADKYSTAFNKEMFVKLQEGKIPQKDLWKYSSNWYKDFDGMAFKTMLRQLLSKWGILSIEMQEAYAKDMASINEDGTYDYVDNEDDLPEEENSDIIENQDDISDAEVIEPPEVVEEIDLSAL